MPAMHTRTNGGFILEQFLIALLILCAVLPVFLSQLQTIANLYVRPADLQDAIAITQLRHIFNIAQNITPSGSTLSFQFRGEERILRISGENLILTPGTQYVLTNIEEVSFASEENTVILCWKRNEEESCAALGVLE
ncbi:hypothetical protein [Galactobacillus timonensis]|uniref:hypothetical protein n=2 Tax=Galactobacillus timonensis TaxID=2041840 RepID=UPI0023F15882|nr:hypothetical protein [Galactobacillus timonensis]MDD7087705.1 hypothetical protein [Galactobacillus timonensis]